MKHMTIINYVDIIPFNLLVLFDKMMPSCIPISLCKAILLRIASHFVEKKKKTRNNDNKEECTTTTHVKQSTQQRAGGHCKENRAFYNNKRGVIQKERRRYNCQKRQLYGVSMNKQRR